MMPNAELYRNLLSNTDDHRIAHPSSRCLSAESLVQAQTICHHPRHLEVEGYLPSLFYWDLKRFLWDFDGNIMGFHGMYPLVN